MVYDSFGPEKLSGSCKVKDQSFKLLTTINSNTVIPNSYISSVGYKGLNYSSNGTKLSNFLYVGNFMNWN